MNREITLGDSTEAVYRILRERFAAGRFSPGDRLLEQTLATELGVSRTPVREAVGRLLADGLVLRAPRGVVVAALEQKEHRDIFILRAALEGCAARLVAERQSRGELAPAQIRQLEEEARAVEDAIERRDNRSAAQANLRLHRAIAEFADNGFVLEALLKVLDRIAVASVQHLADPEWAETVKTQHAALVEAIEAGDGNAAEAAMTQHIKDAASIHQDRTGQV